ncbi:MAG: DHH family phosphoesterase, partial [Paludibacteraceae bacterium]|nr:DHH family phosphoesterase [Paludibacteraceae bacterium]
MNIHWNIKELTSDEQQAAACLSTELDISPVAGRILAGRGIRTAAQARAYIRPSLDSLHDPFLMKDMGSAVDRLCRAIDEHERIMVYGDYDVDGTTAVALMYSFLRTQTDNLIYYIPDRYTEGYGISVKGIDTAKEHGCTLVIALDCGIKAVEKIAYATSLGIDFIVCDHHTPGDEIPKAVAVLNMKRKDCPYPFKELSGCGVGFKLAQAYAQRRGMDMREVYRLLPLLAMSIASDVVPVTGENRILAYYGLKALNAQPTEGMKAIMRVAGIEGKTVNISDLVYRFGPRLNAAGRIKSGAEAVRLLITDDAEAAMRFAKDIDSYNQDRRDYDSKTTDEALEQLEKDPMNSSKFTTVVFSPEWHKGVVGIAASRLTETYYR